MPNVNTTTLNAAYLLRLEKMSIRSRRAFTSNSASETLEKSSVCLERGMSVLRSHPGWGVC